MMIALNKAIAAIITKRDHTPSQRSLLVGLSGIDGSGKGWLTEKIVAQLQQQGSNAVAINLDGWLNLPHIRFSQSHPAEHFYKHAIRFDEMFRQLILPLKENRR
jgi:uridine kinase